MAEKGREIKKLSEAVAEALKNNEKVMSLIAELKERGVVDSETLLSLYLKIGDLLEVSLTTVSREELEKLKTGKQAAPKKAEPPREPDDDIHETIDGRDLSRNEIAFQEWTAERFNEGNWLKKRRLIW
ncbi:MAG: hypothetical protein ACNS63_10365 [Candidatus Nitrospinota bacterium M3_3B_026]